MSQWNPDHPATCACASCEYRAFLARWKESGVDLSAPVPAAPAPEAATHTKGYWQERTQARYWGWRATLDQLDEPLLRTNALADRAVWDARRALGMAIGCLIETEVADHPVRVTAKTFPVYRESGALVDAPAAPEAPRETDDPYYRTLHREDCAWRNAVGGVKPPCNCRELDEASVTRSQRILDEEVRRRLRSEPALYTAYTYGKQSMAEQIHELRAALTAAGDALVQLLDGARRIQRAETETFNARLAHTEFANRIALALGLKPQDEIAFDDLVEATAAAETRAREYRRLAEECRDNAETRQRMQDIQAKLDAIAAARAARPEGL